MDSANVMRWSPCELFVGQRFATSSGLEKQEVGDTTKIVRPSLTPAVARTEARLRNVAGFQGLAEG